MIDNIDNFLLSLVKQVKTACYGQYKHTPSLKYHQGTYLPIIEKYLDNIYPIENSSSIFKSIG